MTTPPKKKLGQCTVDCQRDVLHLVVLVAGTSDAINSFNTPDHRAVSYPSVKKENVSPGQYWDAAFYGELKKLIKSNPKALELFDFHGWSGDNRQGNREVAGAYLVNRLVGANNEKPFYSKSYQSKTIHIHLIGHSHGGNVINEMTQQMAKLGSKWPSTWKVKSFTYLSTPFFQKLHQVKLGGFVHPQAEVLNVYNDYDLTQRMLADFSMYTLHDAIQVNGLTETVRTNIKQLMTALDAIPWAVLIPMRMNDENSLRLYTAMRDFLNNRVRRDGFLSVVGFLAELQKIAEGLNQPVRYKADAGLTENNKVTQSFKLLSDANLANLKRVIAALTASVNQSVDALDTAIRANNYSRNGFGMASLAGAQDLANNVANFLRLPTGATNVAASGVIWQTLVGVLNDAIEVFDDTVTKPDAQFNGARPIEALNVTARDAYHGKPQATNYRKLIAKIEDLEKRYAANPSPNLLLDLLLTLVAHDPKARNMLVTTFNSTASFINSYVEPPLFGQWDAAAKALKATLTDVSNAVSSRFEGEIETGEFFDNGVACTHSEVGSLPYLLIESHSTSRRVLHPEVKSFLQRMMG